MARKIGLKNELAKINTSRKGSRYEETSDYIIDFDPNEFVTSEVLAKVDEAAKNLENGSKHSAPLETIEQLSLEESLEEYKKLYQSKEPEDPEERKKRKQEEARIEKEIKFLEDLIGSSVSDEESIQIEGLDIAGSSAVG